jgi:hypothetical protein
LDDLVTTGEAPDVLAAFQGLVPVTAPDRRLVDAHAQRV